MIQTRTILKVSDNSGAQSVKCIKVLGGFKKKHARIGETILVSVKKLRNRSKNNSKVIIGNIYKALIIRTVLTFKTDRLGFLYKFNENSVVLLNKQNNPIGTRIMGPVPKKLKKLNYQKIINISSGLI